MHRSLCICGLLPRIETRTRVVFIVHQLEADKPTNTGLLGARCLPNSTVVYRGRAPTGGGESATPALFSAAATTSNDAAGAQRLMLFPHASATPLSAWRGRTEPVLLLVPDGTWRQAARTRARLAPDTRDIPCVSLPASSGGRRLRTASSPQRLATLEAVARALGILEGPEVESALLRVYRIMTERTLWSNGRVSAADVTGGIPAGVRSHDPLSTSTGTNHIGFRRVASTRSAPR
jgi:tRNA-uridine aminocarboxypropyltransferase